MLHKEITDKVLKSFYKVYNTFGWGFLENVYQNALLFELEWQGVKCFKEKHIDVFYKGKLVGEYYADIMVEDKVILELKACEILHENHKYQLINYLKATNVQVGLLLNFGKAPEFKRVVFTNRGGNSRRPTLLTGCSTSDTK